MVSGEVSITASARGPLVNIVSWILLVVMCMATFIKVHAKWSIYRKLELDDAYLTAAAVTAVGWIAVESLKVGAGLGQHAAALAPEQIVRFQQTTYASDFLYVVSLCLAKMAILQFLLSLARKEGRRLAVKVSMVLNLVMAVVAVFSIAFQCSLPQPWATLSDSCFDQTSFWIAFAALDILVDLVTVVLPFVLLHDLHLPWERKLPAIVAFALRALIIPIIIARAIFLSWTSGSKDHPFDDFNLAIITSVHINLSVIITCLPFLKSILDSLHTGFLASDIRVVSPSHFSNRTHGSYGLKSSIRAGLGMAQRSRSEGHGYSANVAAGEAEGKNRPRGPSSSSEERMIINQTTTLTVQYTGNEVRKQ